MATKCDLVHVQAAVPILHVLAFFSRIEFENFGSFTIVDFAKNPYSFYDFCMAKAYLCFFDGSSIKILVMSG